MNDNHYLALGKILYLMSETKKFKDRSLDKFRSVLTPCISRNWYYIEQDIKTGKPTSICVWGFLNKESFEKFVESNGALVFNKNVFGNDVIVFTHFISNNGNGFKFLRKIINNLSYKNKNIKYAYGIRGFKDNPKLAKYIMPYYKK